MSDVHDPGPDVRAVWQRTTDPRFDVSLDDVRKRAQRFRARIKRRNLREYVACVFVIAVFGFYAVHFPPLLMKIGAVCTCLAAVFVAMTLSRKGRAGTSDLSGDCRSFHAEELRRQYDLLRTIWLWYLLPFVPGLVLFQIGMTSFLPADRQINGVAGDAICLAVFIFAGWLNHRAARKLKRELDQLQSPPKEE